MGGLNTFLEDCYGYDAKISQQVVRSWNDGRLSILRRLIKRYEKDKKHDIED